MAVDEGKLEVGTTGKSLRTAEQTTSEGLVHVEAMFIADPDAARTGHVAGVGDTTPAGTEDGLYVRQVGPVDIIGLPSGTPAYASGASGTANVPAGAEVTMIMCHATTAGSLTIDGGSSIPLPANTTFFDAATPYVGALAVVFTGTDSYYVAWAVP